MKKIKDETDQTGSNAGKVPDAVEKHLKDGFVTAQESEALQKSGKVVKEIKIIEGQVLHRME